MCVIQSKFTKQTRNFFQNGGGGGRARRAGPGSAFDDGGQPHWMELTSNKKPPQETIY